MTLSLGDDEKEVISEGPFYFARDINPPLIYTNVLTPPSPGTSLSGCPRELRYQVSGTLSFLRQRGFEFSSQDGNQILLDNGKFSVGILLTGDRAGDIRLQKHVTAPLESLETLASHLGALYPYTEVKASKGTIDATCSREDLPPLIDVFGGIVDRQEEREAEPDVPRRIREIVRPKEPAGGPSPKPPIRKSYKLYDALVIQRIPFNAGVDLDTIITSPFLSYRRSDVNGHGEKHVFSPTISLIGDIYRADRDELRSFFGAYYDIFESALDIKGSSHLFDPQLSKVTLCDWEASVDSLSEYMRDNSGALERRTDIITGMLFANDPLEYRNYGITSNSPISQWSKTKGAQSARQTLVATKRASGLLKKFTSSLNESPYVKLRRNGTVSRVGSLDVLWLEEGNDAYVVKEPALLDRVQHEDITVLDPLSGLSFSHNTDFVKGRAYLGLWMRYCVRRKRTGPLFTKAKRPYHKSDESIWSFEKDDGIWFINHDMWRDIVDPKICDWMDANSVDLKTRVRYYKRLIDNPVYQHTVERGLREDWASSNYGWPVHHYWLRPLARHADHDNQVITQISVEPIAL